MNFEHKKYSFPSATHIADIYVQAITPAEKKDVRAVISIVHGMAEHTDRYIDIARYLAEKGFAVFMHDHAGHGKSISGEDDLGFFGEKDGSKNITIDVKSVVEIAKKEYPDVPVIVWGHSMGSFVTRKFIADFPGECNGAVICGTSGANPAAGAGIAIANLIITLLGSRYRSGMLDTMAFGAYNKKFDKVTGFEWLSENEENVSTYVADKLCGYRFTSAGFRDLFTLLADVSSKEWFSKVPSDLPLFLISGDMDPVGNYGKGVTQVYDKLKATNHKNVSIKLYKNLRHEIHNEKCSAAVLDDIIEFASTVK